MNRVRDRYIDQLRLSRHDARPGDLELFADLGIRALRYPVLWERHAPGSLDEADWSFADQRLTTLRRLGVEPILTLLHHGSGPRHTSLVDPEFPEKFARYARAVAERYPWATSYTPINEPLTTARFSCLYGHWFPHARDDRQFARAVVNQCRAVGLAMDEIRSVNPDARLVQTEDLGFTSATEPARAQAALENERRFVSFDLLCGGLEPESVMHRWLCAAGIGPDELAWFAGRPPADVLGVNVYLSSERFLDHRMARYPRHEWGGNGHVAYADVAAPFVSDAPWQGPEQLLRSAWHRYGRPLAVTEVHNSGHREEQLRWLDEVWRAAGTLAAEGAEFVAVTPWALLGSYGWDDLVREDDGRYESGPFDLRGGAPRPTALAAMVSGLAHVGHFDHPVLDAPGWWRRPERKPYGPRGPSTTPGGRPILVAGATGTLARAFALHCRLRGLACVTRGRPGLDVTDRASIEQALDAARPWAVVNTAGYVRLDDAERDVEECHRLNVDGARLLAECCAARGIRLVTFSSDQVFDGSKESAYLEPDAVGPLNVYGRSKALAEAAVAEADPAALIVRTSAFFGPHDEANFATIGLRAVSRGAPWVAICDEVVSPTYVPDLVDASLDLLIDGEHGIWHLANEGAVSWAGFAVRLLQEARLPTASLQEVPAAALDLPARRPARAALATCRGAIMPSLEDAIARYLPALAHAGSAWPAAVAPGA